MPTESSVLRRTVRRSFLTLLTSALTVSVAWAGIGLVPAAPTEVSLDGAPGAAAPQSAQMRVGASRVSLYPRPEAYQQQFPGARWETDPALCATLSEDVIGAAVADPDHGAHLVTATANPWPENPDCLYMGGFGIGPANPITSWDLGPEDPGYAESEGATDTDPTTGLGLWVRSVALSDGQQTLVLTILDAEGYFWDYASKCEACGAKQLTESLAAELNIDAEGIVIASTHAHSAMDLIGGWGFVPDWYMQQVEDAIRESVTEAVTSARPALVEVGEVRARDHNGERRDTYRSAEEQQLTWLRATAVNPGGQPTNEVIATVGAYAAHPTTRGTNGGRAHADWPGAFERRLEDRFGGVGLHFMSGLGNMSARGGTLMGFALADLVGEPGAGTRLTDTDVRFDRATWLQPVTNVPLSALGLPGFFDRNFVMQPASIATGKTPDTAPCVSVSPYSVELPVTAARIGSQFALTAAPGEVFANLTNTIKEQSGALVTMPLGQANDALGYMPQDFEMSEVGQQGLGFVAGGVLIVNYEDSYAIDHCTGDHVLETSIDLLGTL